MTLIYQGFASGLAALNEEIVSPELMMATPAGRAYIKHGKPYADRVHFCSVAEFEHGRLLKWAAARQPAFSGKVYAGGAGLINLSYISQMKPAAAILFDVNAAQTVFWTEVIKALARYPALEDFKTWLGESQLSLGKTLSTLFNRQAPLNAPDNRFSPMRVYKGVYFADTWLAEEGDPEWGGAPDRIWLKSGYEHLHLLAKSGAIGAITLDVCDEKACRQLREYLSAKGVDIDILYISNIFRFLQGDKDWTKRELGVSSTLDSATTNMAGLLNREACMVIDSDAKIPSRFFPYLPKIDTKTLTPPAP